MTKKSLMIVGAGVYQYPAIETAKAMGLKTIAIDYKADLPGLKLADISAVISITDRVKALAFAKSNRIDGIFSMASDNGMATAAYIAKKLDLVSVDPSILRFTSLNKSSMLKKLHRTGVPVVDHHQCADFAGCRKMAGKLNFPMILKPVDGWGSRGLSVAASSKDLKKAFDRARSFSKMGCVALEEFLDGVNVTAEAFFYKKRLVFAGFTEKTVTDDYFIPVQHIMPLTVDEGTKKTLLDMVQKTGQALKIINGPLDVDIKLTSQGPILLEATPRLGGNGVPLLAKLSCGIDLVKASIQVCLGQLPSLHPKKKFCYAGIRVLSSSKEGIIKEFDKPKVLSGNVRLQWDIVKGSQVYPFHMSSCRIGHILAWSDKKWQLEQRLKATADCIKLRISRI